MFVMMVSPWRDSQTSQTDWNVSNSVYFVKVFHILFSFFVMLLFILIDHSIVLLQTTWTAINAAKQTEQFKSVQLTTVKENFGHVGVIWTRCALLLVCFLGGFFLHSCLVMLQSSKDKWLNSLNYRANDSTEHSLWFLWFPVSKVSRLWGQASHWAARSGRGVIRFQRASIRRRQPVEDVGSRARVGIGFLRHQHLEERADLREQGPAQWAVLVWGFSWER